MITDEDLKAAGFKWHDVPRSDRHWLLWIASGIPHAAYEDLGIELSALHADGWRHCWLRADYAGRYSRFLHIRHVHTMADVAQLFTGCTGLPWKPENHLYGSAHDQATADRLRADHDRMDRRIAREADSSQTAWSTDIADPDTARPMIGWQPETKAERTAKREDAK